MNKHKLVSVVIPNFNGLIFLKLCLPSLKKQTYKFFEVLICDNGSDDGSQEYVLDNFPNIKFIRLNNNYGYAKAVNTGIKESKGDLVLLLNNDTELDKDLILNLVNTISKKNISFVTAKILSFNDRKKIDNAGDSIDVVGHLIVRGLDKEDSEEFNQEGETFLASGCGSLVKKEVFESVGYFDESFFMYMEDADFFLRAQLQGFRGFYQPKAKIYHVKMGTSKKDPKMVELQNFRNMTLTIIKDFPLKLILHDFNFIKILLVHLNTIRYLVFKGYFFDVAKTELEIIFNLPKTLIKRFRIQGSKKVSDEYIIYNIYPKKFF